MIKHQITILLAVIVLAIWIVYKLKEKKKNNRDSK
jgi:flagellar biogenesis protein FliO